MRNAVALRLVAFFASVNAAQVTLPTLDLSSLGHVAIAGEFSDISLYRDTRQLTNLSGGAFDSLYLESSDGFYSNLGVSDGTINAVCALNSTGSQTIFVAGNFSRIGTTEAVNVASYNPTTKVFSALSSGVMGTVQALYCDSADNQVYIGGDFEMSNSTNAAIWDVADQRFNALPFGGFDGPVSTIVANGSSLLFGGRFDSVVDGVSSSSNEPQQINLQTAYVGQPIHVVMFLSLTRCNRSPPKIHSRPMHSSQTRTTSSAPLDKTVPALRGFLRTTRPAPGPPP